jgi:hypothetical protein
MGATARETVEEPRRRSHGNVDFFSPAFLDRRIITRTALEMATIAGAVCPAFAYARRK